MFKNALNTIIKDIKFNDWTFVVEDRDPGFLFYARFRVCPCSPTEQIGPEQTTRKWYISPWATKSEVVQTALKLVLTALEHEARENFVTKNKQFLDHTSLLTHL